MGLKIIKKEDDRNLNKEVKSKLKTQIKRSKNSTFQSSK